MYHVNDNNTYTLIPIAFVNTYCTSLRYIGYTLKCSRFVSYTDLQRDGPTQKNISAFPAGLRMLAGSMYRTPYNDSNPADKAVQYVCLNYQGNSSQTNEFPTDKNCPDGLRAQIVFPSCWDGKNLDSGDHQSHMSYPVGGAPDNGDCPPDHPEKVGIPRFACSNLCLNFAAGCYNAP